MAGASPITTLAAPKHTTQNRNQLIHAHNNHRIPRHRSAQNEPDHNHNQPQHANFPQRRPETPHHDGRRLVVPVAVTAGDKIESLRQWASGRCLSADRAGVYSRSGVSSGGRVRSVVREPGVN